MSDDGMTFLQQRMIEINDLRSMLVRTTNEMKAASTLALESSMIAHALALRVEAAESALAERDKPCIWTYVLPTCYVPSCRDEIAMCLDGKFCSYCGHPIEVQP